MIRRLGLFLFSFLLAFPLKGQDSVQARKWVHDLCSDALAGRGYLRNGSEKAATYLAEAFRNLGLSPLFSSGKAGYFQPFSLEVNTITKAPQLQINGRSLQPGKDFIVSASSPSSSQKVTGAEAQQYLKWTDKLTWTVGRKQDSEPRFTILRKAADSASVASVNWRVRAKLQKQQVRNVGGLIRGKKYPDKWILISAHYDHLGGMGEGIWFKGAHDNASGVAVMLDLARHYLQPNHQPDYTLVFVAFAAEEAGLLGSSHFADHLPLPLIDMHFQLNLDLLGGGSQGVTIVNSYRYPVLLKQLKQLGAQHGLAAVNARDNAPNSDHFPLAQKGFPAFFLYTLGDVTAYHDVDDLPEPLPFSRYSAIFSFLRDWINQAAILSFRKE